MQKQYRHFDLFGLLLHENTTMKTLQYNCTSTHTCWTLTEQTTLCKFNYGHIV